MFHIGQEVVCIAPANNVWYEITIGFPFPEHPISKCIYRIAGFQTHEPYELLILAELPWSWDARFFRPVRKTSIEVFTRLLAPVKDKQHGRSPATS